MSVIIQRCTSSGFSLRDSLMAQGSFELYLELTKATAAQGLGGAERLAVRLSLTRGVSGQTPKL